MQRPPEGVGCIVDLSNFKEPLYLQNVAFLKSYAGKFHRIVVCASVRNKNVELDENDVVKKCSVNTEKLSNNLCRAKSTVLELALCNPWELFVTLTFSPEKCKSRYDLEPLQKALSQWLRNYGKNHSCRVKYLLIPEKHKDGAWHLHGLFMGLPPDHLTVFSLKDKIPKKIREKLERGEKVYNWCDYANKFGFVTIEPIRSPEGVSYYITKYITKELDKSVSELGAHLYYASKGLKRAEVKKRGTMLADIAPTYVSEHCVTYDFDGRESLYYLSSLIG